jgi:hypothetical protein
MREAARNLRFVDWNLFRDVIGGFASGVTVYTARDRGESFNKDRPVERSFDQLYVHSEMGLNAEQAEVPAHQIGGTLRVYRRGPWIHSRTYSKGGSS